MNGDIEVENVLRATLAEHAQAAPNGSRLAQRIIADANSPGGIRNGRSAAWWRHWTLPIVAAASIAGVVVLIVSLVQWSRPDAPTAGHPAASEPRPALPATPSGASRVATVHAPLADFRSMDLTFVSLDQGWTLGSSQCRKAPSLRCTAIMRTRDGGAHWTPVPNPPAYIAIDGSCSGSPCVDHIRFADASTGYAFGASVLFMTTDGGQHWAQQSGGATSLEVANGTAIRVAAGKLQVSPIGEDAWRLVNLPGTGALGGDVVRSRSRVYVPAAVGGFYVSQDDGKTWIERSNPCGVRPIQTMTAAADGSLVVLCSPAGSAGPRLLTSDDCGRSFTTWRGPMAGGELIAAADSSTVLVLAGRRLERGVDRGRSWTVVGTDTTSGDAAFLGFESSQTGRWVTGDGSVIWTTGDAGRTWTARTFG